MIILDFLILVYKGLELLFLFVCFAIFVGECTNLFFLDEHEYFKGEDDE